MNHEERARKWLADGRTARWFSGYPNDGADIASLTAQFAEVEAPLKLRLVEAESTITLLRDRICSNHGCPNFSQVAIDCEAGLCEVCFTTEQAEELERRQQRIAQLETELEVAWSDDEESKLKARIAQLEAALEKARPYVIGAPYDNSDVSNDADRVLAEIRSLLDGRAKVTL